ncbi:MAG: extracellular solute-binding protein [Candidatus Nanopelagicales bacterium]
MNRTSISALAAGCLALAACTGQGNDGQATVAAPSSAPSAKSTGDLRVWLMKGSQPDSVIKSINAAFNKAFPDVKVTVELQEAVGIQDRLADALDSEDPPDVAEVYNGLTARFGDEGVLADLTPVAKDFKVGSMLPGLVAYGNLDGVTFGVPYYGWDHIVVYNKAQFKKAEVKVPKTVKEFAAVAKELAKTYKSDEEYSAFYFPGRFWEGALPFVWDNGGEVAVQADGKWTGTLDSAQARAGLAELKGLVDAYSNAPTDADEADNLAAFKKGDIGMMIDAWWVPGTLDAGDLKGKIGAFALPGRSSKESAPVYVSGSDLTAPAHGSQLGLAVEWMKIATGQSIQTRLAKAQGVIPNSEAAFGGLDDNKFVKVAAQAATNGRPTPVTPRWGSVESAEVLPDMVSEILSGQRTIEEASAEASQEITDLLAE